MDKDEDLPIKIPGQPVRYGPASVKKEVVDPPKRRTEAISVPSQVVRVGRMNRLKVVTDLDFGLYLDGKEHGEILMPRKYVEEGTSVDDFVDVFIYLDSEDRFIATTETPYAMEGELAFLKVVSTTKIGAFLDWGLIKDLLVPFREQRERMVADEYYIVYIYFDQTSERLVASSKIHKFLKSKADKYRLGDEVELIICNQFDLGYQVIIDRQFVGAVFSNEIFQPIEPGQQVKGYIKTIRADGKIDVELQKTTNRARDILSEKILADLRAAGGFLPLTDKTDPEEIYDSYRVSKRAFKRALGGLYKKRQIILLDDGIRLL
ncbi:MAG: S1 RNA-binding domain-containing protein [Puniceicoccaceae bacterium]